MNFPPWRQSLARSLHKHRSKPEAKYFQLATINQAHRPRNRTLVFRGFVSDSNDILAITDARSDKYQELITTPFAEIAWYFTVTREQYRLACSASMLTHSTKDKQNKTLVSTVWADLSSAAKSQFTWPKPKQAFNESEWQTTENNLASDPPSDFVVLRLAPIEIEYLQLKTQPQTRMLYQYHEKNGNWTEQRVNP